MKEIWEPMFQSKPLYKQVLIPLFMLVLLGCNSKTQMVSQNEVVDSTYIDGASLSTQSNRTDSSVFDWQVQVKGLELGFTDIKLLQDNGLVARLNNKGAGEYSSFGILDSEGSKIYKFYREGEVLIKLNQEGKFDWSKDYFIESDKVDYYRDNDFVHLEGYTIVEPNTIVALVFLTDGYFEKIEEEKRQIIIESSEESMPPTVEAEKGEGEYGISRARYALQFLDKNGKDSVVIIPQLDLNGKIFAFESLGNGRFAIAGKTYRKDIISVKGNKYSGGSGDFIAVVNSTGKILWSDVTQFPSNPGYAYHEQPYKPYLAIDRDNIYLCSHHFGEVKFSNQKTIKSNTPWTDDSSHWTYVISYSKNGGIQWALGNEGVSYLTAVRAVVDGIFIAQTVYDNRIFGLAVDNSGNISEYLTHITSKGKPDWTRGFPVENIHSIAIDNQGLPVIMGNYNDVVYGNPHTNKTPDELPLIEGDDLFIIGVDNMGKPRWTMTKQLDIRTDFKAKIPQMILGPDNAIYLTWHTDSYFAPNLSEGTKQLTEYDGNASFLWKLPQSKQM